MQVATEGGSMPALMNLTQRDVVILGVLGAVGFAPAALIARFFPSQRACRRRLAVLDDRGLVTRAQVDGATAGLPAARGGAVVTLAARGVGVVRRLGGMARDAGEMARLAPLAASIMAAAEVYFVIPPTATWAIAGEDGVPAWAWAAVRGGGVTLAVGLDPPLAAPRQVDAAIRTAAAWVAAAAPGEARHVAWVAATRDRRVALMESSAVAAGERAGWLHTQYHPAAVARRLFLSVSGQPTGQPGEQPPAQPGGA
jgi:hypothetical protein